MFPRLHAAQHALLLLRRKAREMLQPLPQQQLALRRQTAECRIVLQRVLLLAGRQAPVAAQPVAGMPLSRAKRLPILNPLRNRPEVVALRRAWRYRHHNDRHGQPRRRKPSRPQIFPPHSPRPWIRPTLHLVLTDSLPHPFALPGHPANRNQNTDHDSFPKPADRSLPYRVQSIAPANP